MSEFLIITPNDPDWIQFTDEQVQVLLTITDPGTIISYCDNDLFNISVLLRDYALISDEATLTAGRLIPTGNVDIPYQFWYRLV